VSTGNRVDELLNRPHPGHVALACASLGWRVHPLRRGDKKPIMTGWPDRATLNTDEILDWWSANGRYAGSVTGIATGRETGFWVLDVDKHGKPGQPSGFDTLAALEAEHGPLPETFTVRTPSGGEHRYFRYPGDREVVTKPNTCGPSLDTRGFRGQVVAPGTWLGTGEYRVVREGVEIVDAPAWLLDLVERRVNEWGQAVGGEGDEGEWSGEPPHDVDGWLAGAATLGHGEQEWYLFRFMSALRARAVSEPEMRRLGGELIERFAVYDEAEPWTERDVDAKIKSVSRYPAGRSTGPRPVVVPQYPEVEVEVELPPVVTALDVSDPVTGTGPDNPHRNTDRANGIEVARFLDGRVLWTPENGWFIFNGKRWAPDVELVRTLLVGEFTDQLRRRATSGDARAEEAEVLMARANRLESASGLNAALSFTEPELAVSVTRLDADPWLLNCPNGTLDLRTGVLGGHDPKQYLSRITPTPYDPAATDDVWTRTLWEALEGDEDRLRVMARFAGYTLTGRTTEKKMLVISGPTNTGKSTITEPLYHVLGAVHDGGYATTWDADVVQADSNVNRAEKLNKARGARLVLVAELEKGSRMADSFVKQFTGGDTMDARGLYKDSYSYRPDGKLWMSTNYVPQSPDRALQERLLLLPFKHVVEGARKDPRVKAHLEDSADAKRAILAWAVRGCLSWRGGGDLGVMPWLDAARAEYATESDPILQFIQEELVQTGERADASHVDQVWKHYELCWGPENQQRPLKRRALEAALKERGLEKGRGGIKGGHMRWEEYRLRSCYAHGE
jgi:P4 family phage/plasmid primase-like protien